MRFEVQALAWRLGHPYVAVHEAGQVAIGNAGSTCQTTGCSTCPLPRGSGIYESHSAVRDGYSNRARQGTLREYWTKALARIASLRVTVDRVVWDPDGRELAIIYKSETDGKARRVSENLRFDAVGQVVAAEVFHGVA